MTLVHLVSHTHWDREWYDPAVRFRQRLVALVDELIDRPPSAGASFLLDGQAVILEDYLAVRPERVSEVARLLQSGVLEAGPWYVLADELIPSGEALVRNLLAGRRVMRSLRAESPAVLYCPDSFGHPAAIPTLAAGFGFRSAIVWRGYGSRRWPAGDAAWWDAASGERVLLIHLSKSGYELGSNLPTSEAEALERWSSIREELLTRNTLGVALLLNGADHHARQEGLDAAVALLVSAAVPVEVRSSSLRAFVADAEARADVRSNARADVRSVARFEGRAEVNAIALPVVTGELRDSYGFTWTLQGTFATRAAQKRRNAQLERLMLRDVEPWVALAQRAGAPPARALVQAAWKSLLLCHPHDTLCGCSTDEVARAMDARLDEAESQAKGIRADSLAALIGHSPVAARLRRAEWRPVTLVRNPAARAREGFALLRLNKFLAHEAVGLGSGTDSGSESRATTESTELKLPRVFALAGVGVVQVLTRSIERERTESPRHYPDNDLVAVAEAAVWVPEIPAYGVRGFADASRNKKSTVPYAAQVVRDTLSNGLISVRVRTDGRVEFTDLESGRTVRDLLSFESLVDEGDSYTPSLRGPKFTAVFARKGWRVVHRGPVRAAVEGRWTFGERGRGGERMALRAKLVLDAGARWLRLIVSGVNEARDHRLRLRIATDVATDVTTPARAGATRLTVADAAFGPVVRYPVILIADDARMETDQRTAPLHRYVSLFDDARGATLFSDGLAEYESADDGFSVTLVRAIGELSRSGLPERPGHAGWPTPTPEAQCAGAFGAELAVMMHGPRSAAVIDQIERAADDILLPLTGQTLRSALVMPAATIGVELIGEGLACSAIKESEDGEWLVLRCVNLLDTPVTGSWQLGGDLHEARLSRLDETALDAIPTSGSSIPFHAGPRSTVTLLVR